ncbi:hypothetical protein HYW59_01480 [Candidatus Kaiserbacteria bacterium]|nr:hypothetical protein [Candidatus Kaiserbacteria bacterium]
MSENSPEENKTPSEYDAALERIRSLRGRFYKAQCTFYAFEGMQELIARDVVGDDQAEKNSHTINTFRNFFIPARESLRINFFLELAKIFDASDQALHITKVVNYVDRHRETLTAEALKKHGGFFENRRVDKEMIDQYLGVKNEDLLEIRSLLATHEKTIEELKTYRDSWLAHDDIQKPEPPKIDRPEIIGLFELLKKILNTLTGKLSSESMMWDHVERDVKHHTKLVIEYLQRFEPYRIKEIEADLDKEFNKLPH